MACAGYDDVVLTLVFELLEEVDLYHCCLTCRRWNFVAKREEDARVKRDEARWELLRSEWEQQHSDWETTRAQLSQDVCSGLDKELCNTLFYLLDLTDQEEISVILGNMEDLYKRGAGTFHFHRSFCSCDNLDAEAAECVIKIVTRMNFEIDEPAAARVLQKAIGMGLAAKGSQVCAQVGPIHPLRSEVLRILGGDRLSLFSDVYYIGYLEAIFETLLEPMAVVSSDFALEWDIDMLTFCLVPQTDLWQIDYFSSELSSFSYGLASVIDQLQYGRVAKGVLRERSSVAHFPGSCDYSGALSFLRFSCTNGRLSFAKR
jgi:hypothetical protein